MTNNLSTLGYRIVPDVLSQPSLRQWLTVLKPIVEAVSRTTTHLSQACTTRCIRSQCRLCFVPLRRGAPSFLSVPECACPARAEGEKRKRPRRTSFAWPVSSPSESKRGVRRTRSRPLRGSTETVGSGGHCERPHRMCGWPILVRLFLCTVRSMYKIGYTYLSGHVWHVTASCFDRRAAPRDDFNVRCRTSLPQPHRGKHSKILSLLYGSFLRTWMETTEGCEF